MLYAYAIGEFTESVAGTGLRGAPLRVVRDADGLAAIVSDHPEPRLAPDADDLLAHEAVVEAVLEKHPLLPMRAGAGFTGDSDLIHALRDRQAEFRRALRRVAGAVELGVRAALQPEPCLDPEPVLAGGPGTAYMLGRLERSRAAEHHALAIHEPLAALARADRWQLKGGDRGLVAAYLVDRDKVEVFGALVEDLRHRQATDIVCTGPWPPYSFVAEEG